MKKMLFCAALLLVALLVTMPASAESENVFTCGELGLQFSVADDDAWTNFDSDGVNYYVPKAEYLSLGADACRHIELIWKQDDTVGALASLLPVEDLLQTYMDSMGSEAAANCEIMTFGGHPISTRLSRGNRARKHILPFPAIMHFRSFS